MYLSRIALDTRRRETMRALAFPQILHGAVESSFSYNTGDQRERVLWRVDWLYGVCYLLVLSPTCPDFAGIAKQFGCPQGEQAWETKDYSHLLARLQTGRVWQFRLCANPVRSSFKEKDEGTGRGKVFAHVTQEQQRQWLLTRAENCGFALADGAFDVVHTEWLKFHKNKKSDHEVTLRKATFEGVLTISDDKRFKQALIAGVGRSKAYGCGLLTIASCGCERRE
jgi:CRISPR system Cascade subunit CasE